MSRMSKNFPFSSKYIILVIIALQWMSASSQLDVEEVQQHQQQDAGENLQQSNEGPRPNEVSEEETSISPHERKAQPEKEVQPTNDDQSPTDDQLPTTNKGDDLSLEPESEHLENENLKMLPENSPAPQEINSQTDKDAESLNKAVSKSVEFVNGSADLATVNETSSEFDDNSLDFPTVNETLLEVANSSLNSSGKSENQSSNGTNPEPLIVSARWNCSTEPLENRTGVIVVKNETQLAGLMSVSNASNSCFLLYFYLHWCEFCAQMSLLLNTVGRVYHGLPVLAVDAYAMTSITGRFGITGVPSLLLFFNGRPVAKFNRSRSLEHVQDFIADLTGLTASDTVAAVDADYEGPLVTKIEEKGDIYLLLSLACLSLIFVISLCRTETAQNYVKSSITKFKEWALHQKTD